MGIHSSVDGRMHYFQWLWILLLRSFMYKFFFCVCVYVYFHFSWVKTHLDVAWLSHTVILYLPLEELPNCVHSGCTVLYFSVWGFQFFRIAVNIYCSPFKIIYSAYEVVLIVIWFAFSWWITCWASFIHILVIWIPYLEKRLSKSFAYF